MFYSVQIERRATTMQKQKLTRITKSRAETRIRDETTATKSHASYRPCECSCDVRLHRNASGIYSLMRSSGLRYRDFGFLRSVTLPYVERPSLYGKIVHPNCLLVMTGNSQTARRDGETAKTAFSNGRSPKFSCCFDEACDNRKLRSNMHE